MHRHRRWLRPRRRYEGCTQRRLHLASWLTQALTTGSRSGGSLLLRCNDAGSLCSGLPDGSAAPMSHYWVSIARSASDSVGTEVRMSRKTLSVCQTQRKGSRRPCSRLDHRSRGTGNRYRTHSRRPCWSQSCRRLPRLSSSQAPLLQDRDPYALSTVELMVLE